MKEKLLVLDDELLILRSLDHLFQDDYEVFTTTDAEAALLWAKNNEIAVILCDERMPAVSGHEFFRRVRDVSRATRIMMSGYADMNALTEAVNSGQIFAYVAKPWEPLKLKANVKAAAFHFELTNEVEHERGLLRALMENIPDPIYFKDRQSRFIRVNQAHARVLGAKDAAECIGRNDSDYFEPADALRWCLQEEAIVESARPQVDRIEQLKNPEGGLSWMSTTKVPMLDQNGQVSGIASISRDITALKSSEELLREQNEHNRMILETAKDAFISMDPDGSITAWNPQAERTFGWTAEEVIGRNLWDTAFSAAPVDGAVRDVKNFLAAARASLSDHARSDQAIELVALHRDGRTFPAEATIWPVRVKGVYSVNAFVRDISGRRRAEAALTKETTLIQLLQSLTEEANRSSTIEQTAKACINRICSHMGWPVGHAYLRVNNSPEDPISSGFWRVEGDEQFEAFREISDLSSNLDGPGMPGRVLSSGKPQWVVNLADEEPMSTRTFAAVTAGLRSAFGFPIYVEEQIVGILEFFTPKTVHPDEEFLAIMGHIGSEIGQVILRQRAEEELHRAKASAESANRAKSEFLTTMSHEMRTPMNAILGMADLLSESSLSEEQLDYVRIFQKSGANLLDLINDLLDLSKVESGYLELESIGFDLRALLDKIIEMMRSRGQDRGLEIILEIRPDVPKGLLGDPNRLRQILINLIGNALKFTEHGSVCVRVQKEPGEVEGWLRFSVVDTGIGIADDKTKIIFERFTQADSSTTRKYGGSGLGLAICKGLTELMGGAIGCTSKIGEGSTFFFTAPFGVYSGIEAAEIHKPSSKAIVIAPRAEFGRAYRVLIAEDSEYNLVLIQAYLKDSGFELDIAENGEVAVKKTISMHPDIILMDLEMPVMDGLAATRAIREWEAATNRHPIPILMLTAHATREAVAKSLEAGSTEHLTKPIQKAILCEAIVRNVGTKIRITPPGGIERLVPGYLANVRRDMSESLTALDSKDCKTAGQMGHRLKGSGEGYGFPEITRVGAELELAAIAANENAIRSQILRLSSYLDRVEIVVEEGVGNTSMQP